MCFRSIKRPLMAMKKLGQTICSSSNKGRPSYSLPATGNPLKVVLLELWICNPGSKLPVSSGVLSICLYKHVPCKSCMGGMQGNI